MSWEADVVIAGAGSSGCVLAARLSEESGLRVLLLEAGPDYANRRLPADLEDGRQNSTQDHDWGYKHLPRRPAPRLPMPRGRVVGGSSAVNTCIALRGQPWDYDEWADLGLKRWGWESVLPYFKKLERDTDFDNEWHGQDGPIPIRRHRPEELVPFQAAFIQSCRELGFEEAPDANDPTTTGVGPHAMNKLDGRRMSAALGYLTADVRARPNLRIESGVTVRRILLDGNRATGLEVEGPEGVRVVRAGEVILAAGAIATPGILLRSGIGHREDLERIGVPVEVERNGVGRRLLDHPGTGMFLRPRNQEVLRLDDPLVQTILRYKSRNGDKRNDMILQPGSKVPLRAPLDRTFLLMTPIGKPEDYGRLTYHTADPHERPQIDTLFFRSENDLDKGVEALEIGLELADRPCMRELATPVFPPARVLRNRTFLKAWIRRFCDSGYHPSGTTKMGLADDPEAVVDDRGRVFGTAHLRVVDASVLPTMTTANIHLTVLMMAERLADDLREDLQSSVREAAE